MISDLVNSSLDFKLGSKTVKVVRLSIGEFFATAEQATKQAYLNNIQAVSAMLSGKEKIDYLMGATKDIPAGEKLNELAMEWVKSPKGVSVLLMMGLSKNQNITEDDLNALITGASPAEIELVIQYMLGIPATPATPATIEADGTSVKKNQ
jgi:hypothetical protein